MHARLYVKFAAVALLVLLAGTVGARGPRAVPAVAPTPFPPAADGGAPLAPGLDWVIERVDAPKEFYNLEDHSLDVDASGHPHIAYGGDFLYYARHDGSTWRIETVDPSPGAGTSFGGTSIDLSLDPAGHPHISYLYSNWTPSGWNTCLKYAHYDGSTWHIETVDDTGPAGRYTSIAVDGYGRPHVGYIATDGLRYATHDGTAWQVELVAPAHKDVSIALDGTGTPYIAFIEFPNDYIRVAWKAGGSWHLEMVETTNRNQSVSIAVDGYGRPHVCYSPFQYGLRYAYFDGTSWQVEDVTEHNADFRNASLAVDAAGSPHIAAWGLDLYYVYRSGSSWQSEVITSGENGGTPALALDPAGEARVAYVNVVDTFTHKLEYAVRAGSTWTVETVDVTGQVGEYISLAVDPTDHPHIGYQDLANTALKYAHHDGSSWQSEIVDSDGGTALYTSIAVDGAGRPHISYNSAAGLTYAHHDGSSWQIEQVTDEYALGTSLALDAAGRPHMAYHHNALKYAHNDGTGLGFDQGWQIEVVDGGYELGIFPSLALDSSGRPHISYYDRGGEQLKYAYHDGTSWQIGVVESSVPRPDAGRTALALDALDHPHVSYYDYARKALKYAFHDGSDWQVEVITVTGYFQDYNDLVLDAAGRPHISFLASCSEAGICLNVAHHQGSSWQIEMVDGNEGLGMCTYNSLAIDTQDQLHLSYRDSGDLKHAHQACFPLQEVEPLGPTQLPLGVSGLYSATYSPPTATLPVTLTWDNGTIGLPASYLWTQTGTHALAVTAANACGQAQAHLTVSVFCQPLEGVDIDGPLVVVINHAWTYGATPQPLTASRPLTYTWDNGAVGATTTYSWTLPGMYTLTVTADNVCQSLQQAHLGVRVLEAWPYSVYLPLAIGGPGPARSQ